MRRRLLLSMILLIALSPIYAQLKLTPPNPVTTRELPQVLQSFTAEEIADAAAKAGITLYTEADAVSAIEAASKTAAETAVAKAVPEAVAVATKDVSDRYEVKLWIWRGATAIGALCAIVIAILK